MSAGRRSDMGKGSEGVVVVVEDDGELRGLLLDFLALRGYAAHGAADGHAGADLVYKLRPGLVVLDIAMPGLDGLTVCQMLKADRRTRTIPILILTSNATTENRLKAVEYAADHFLAKPIADLEEFHRWVRALMSRAAPPASGSRVVGGVLTLNDEETTAAALAGPPLALPPKLYAVLCELAARPGEVLSREYLVDKVWNNAVRDREVDVAVSRLRSGLGAAGAAVVSVPGRGYRLDLAALSRARSA